MEDEEPKTTKIKNNMDQLSKRLAFWIYLKECLNALNLGLYDSVEEPQIQLLLRLAVTVWVGGILNVGCSSP